MNKTRMAKIGLAVFSSALALAAAELYLRLNSPWYVYNGMRSVVQQTHSEPNSDPQLAYLPKVNLKRRFKNKEFDTEVEINSARMRDKEYPLKVPQGRKRIISIGDSFVFGWGVESAQTVSKLLESRHLKNVEVLNMGVSGYCDSQALRRLETGGLAFSPDLVLFFVSGPLSKCGDDYQFVEGELYWKGFDPRSLKHRISRFLRKKIYVYAAVRDALNLLIERMEPEGPKPDDSPELLARLEGLGVRNRFRPVIVFFPLKNDLSGPPPYLESYCAARDWGFVDLTPALDKSAYFELDDHWNRDGHAAAARAISKYLSARGFLEAPYFLSLL